MLHWALHRQPGKRFWPAGEGWRLALQGSWRVCRACRTSALTLGATLAELLAEVLGGDAGTGGVAGLSGVVAGLVVVDVVG